MKDYIIHIGYPKTATTWFIQNFYPFIKNAEFFSPEKFFNITPNDSFSIDKIQSNLCFASNNQKIIIADARFAGIINFRWDNGKYRLEIMKEFEDKFPNAKIVIFIRNQIDFLCSAYPYYIKRGGTFNKKTLLSYISSKGIPFSLEYLDYYKLIELYKNTFGSQNVYIYLYEEFLENNQLFLNKYIKEFNFDISLEKISFSKKNIRLRKYLMSLFRFVNMFSNEGIKLKYHFFHINGLYSWFRGKSISLNNYRFFGSVPNINTMYSKKTYNQIYDFYKGSNKKLIEEYNLSDIKKYNYPL